MATKVTDIALKVAAIITSPVAQDLLRSAVEREHALPLSFAARKTIVARRRRHPIHGGDGVLIVESGQVTVIIPLDGEATLRLRTMGPGTVVGEIAMILQTRRSASVIANTPTVVYRLSTAATQRLEREHPGVAFAFHKFMACLLADRLQKTDRTLRAMLD